MADVASARSNNRAGASSPIKKDDVMPVVQWIKKRLRVPNYQDNMWTFGHEDVVASYLCNESSTCLIAFVSENQLLFHERGNTNMQQLAIPEKFMFFLKPINADLSMVKRPGDVIHLGFVSNSRIEALFSAMTNIYIPATVKSQSWPDSVKRDYIRSLHKFMASLTEAVNNQKGKTVLYIPAEDVQNIDKVSKDKDIVQRLESTVIHWTRQIKEVVGNQDSMSSTAETEGPLDEIEFWRDRTVNLSGISEQLHRPGVQQILLVLEAAKSSYLKPFQTLSEMILNGSLEANDNLQFLQVLVPSCEELASAEPQKIPTLLPKLLQYIRMVWSVSTYYNTEERMTSLLRKISNEVISRCCSVISLKEIFEGDVDSSIANLQQSISCGVQWKEIYQNTKRLVARAAKKSAKSTGGPLCLWDYDETSIFAEIDAFVQRCRDLLEVCEGQLQFAVRNLTERRRKDTLKAYPLFSGIRGPDIVHNLVEIESHFMEHLRKLRDVNYWILDVKATKWHEDHNAFKTAVKELDVMMQNCINSAFDSVGSVATGVQFLEAFQQLAQRSTIKRCVDKKTTEIYGMFKTQIESTRAMFEKFRNNPPLLPDEPKFSGAGMWAKSILKSMESDADALSSAFYLNGGLQGDATMLAFKEFKNALEEFVANQYQNWMLQLQNADQTALHKLLDKPLLAYQHEELDALDEVEDMANDSIAGAGVEEGKGSSDSPKKGKKGKKGKKNMSKGKGRKGQKSPKGKGKKKRKPDNSNPQSGGNNKLTPDERAAILKKPGATGFIESNFDRMLIKVFREVNCWDKFKGSMRVAIPYVAHDVTSQRDTLTVVQKHIMLVVQGYNGILSKLAEDERRLFQEHLRRLDRRVSPGFNQLNWSSKDVTEWFVKECKRHCKDLVEIVTTFHKARESIQECCKHISNLSLISFQKNRVYEGMEFARIQEKHRRHVIDQLKSYHQKVADNLKTMYEFFRNDSKFVRQQWVKFVANIDKQLLAAFRKTCRNSLVEFSKAINGDKKNEPQALLAVNLALQDCGGVAYRPQMPEMCSIISDVTAKLLTCVEGVSRLADIVPGSMSSESKATPSYYESIKTMPDVIKVFTTITTGMDNGANQLEEWIVYWKKYDDLHMVDKNKFMSDYAVLIEEESDSIGKFEKDIAQHKRTQLLVQDESISETIGFIKIDCSVLKAALVDHCLQWQNVIASLLNERAKNELFRHKENFIEHTETFSVPPSNLDELSERFELLEKIQGNKNDTQRSFSHLRDSYSLLTKFEVATTEDEQSQLGTLSTRWDAFNNMLDDAKVMLEKTKKSMRINIEVNLETFNEDIETLREESQEGMPYGGDFSISEAEDLMDKWQIKYDQMNGVLKKLIPGLRVYEMDMPETKPLDSVASDMKNLRAVWAIAKEWDDQYNIWKDTVFSDIDTDKLEAVAAQYNKRIVKMGRQLKGGRWRCWGKLKDRVVSFRDTLPLIMGLRSDAMRPRHWNQLQDEIGKRFDVSDADFTLDKVFELGLHKHSDFIGTLADTANKELAIEQALEGIEEVWKTVDVDMVEYKDIYFKIRSTEDLFAQLEDNVVALSTMKASRFFGTFEKPITKWERCLSNMSEIIELALAVQRQWMYLESIFTASEDIRKQLPAESVLFDNVNKTQGRLFTRMQEKPNAVIATTWPNLLEDLNEMDQGLEKIQKSLDQYLETKRQMFPRFYFLSNDDLLEILGQQKDPMQVQKHIKKCYVGIKTLIMTENVATRKVMASGMNAPDGESVPFNNLVLIDGPVELWLILVEEQMVETIQKFLCLTLKNYPKANKEKKLKWIKEWQGQLLIIAGKIMWTSACTRALEAVTKGNKGAVKKLKKKQVKYLNECSDFVRGKLSKIERKKLVALITMEIHSRDVMERMVKQNATRVTDFVWLSQQRFYFMKDEGDNGFGRCRVKQTNTELEFGYEYQGNNGRLVVTPLTDRCVLTLTTALCLQRGGNPLGPAGTGKTETVKDLGKNLAKYVVVFNCSDGLDYKSVGRMFSGLVQSGGWGCFDEFNRIEIEVLSVIAGQILSIMNAIAARKRKFLFEGQMIACRWSCGIFVTMNPGYAGRTELPDNLKSLMRPVAMMAPDLAQIAEVMLMAEGFREARILAKKAVTLYELMVQQLSKQSHYDYGMRSLKAVLGCCGTLKRSEPDLSEDAIALRALKDMNVPKFVTADFELFLLLLGDLFPGLELPVVDYGQLMAAIERELERQGLQVLDFIKFKTVQVFESKALRHCNMLVGSTLAGKSTAWKTLQRAKTSLCKEFKTPGFHPVRTTVINAKSVTMGELYGAYDLSTMEWQDGVLSSLFRGQAVDDRSQEKWLVLDGPVDTLWIESMNTVMDDNKTLTLINGDRIAMTNWMSLIFEVRDLDVASPATVSRAGMIYLDVDELGWRPYVTSWLDRWCKDNAELRKVYESLFDKYVDPMLEFKNENCKDMVPIPDFNAVMSLCNLLEVFACSKRGVSESKLGDKFSSVLEKVFTFCATWSIGGGVGDDGRSKFDEFTRDIEAHYPPAHTIYEYYVVPSSNEFKLWSDKIPKSWRPPRNAKFFDIIVPTVDTVRNVHIMKCMMQECKPTLIVGNTGTGKTILITEALSQMGDNYISLNLNFSAATTPAITQDIIEGSMEKRAKGKYGPPGGKKLIVFVDDLNMPAKDLFGSQAAVEILRQWMDYGGWYDRKKATWKQMNDMQLIASMGPPGGGRSQISERTQSRFNLINFTMPTDEQLLRIFETMLVLHFHDFEEEVKNMAGNLAMALIRIYKTTVTKFLPTPVKCHYLFNLRDIAKVIQGIRQTDRNCCGTKESLLRLFAHETCCVFSNRFTSFDDQESFRGVIDDQLKMTFDISWENLMDGQHNPQRGPVFTDFLSAPIGVENIIPYEEVSDFKKLKTFCESTLEDYNCEPGYLPMNLVLFDDAVFYICAISRVLKQPRGNCMLVGVGGSGRQSLTRIASFICKQKVFNIEISKRYSSVDFHEDLKKLFMMTGVENNPTVFLFNDVQIKEESFLEDVNNILSIGQVPNLFEAEDMTEIIEGVKPAGRLCGLSTQKELYEFFVERVRSNLHVVLAMSPVGSSFRNRCRMFPSLVNCTTITWFLGWPADALEEVALKFLEDARLDDDVILRLAQSFAAIHKSVVDKSEEMLVSLKRHNYVTPTHYLELVKGYSTILGDRRHALESQLVKLQNGMDKLDESKEQVEEMSIALERKQEIVGKKQKDCEELLVVIVSERRIADEQRKQVEADEIRISKEAAECKAISDDAQADLGRALPALEKAMEEVDKLDKSSISEVKAYSSPPPLVMLALAGVMTLFKGKTDWASAKKKIGESNFLSQVKGYDKDNVPAKVVNKLKKYIRNPDFDPEAVFRVSKAAGALCVWCHAIFTYSQVHKEVAPKREALKKAMKSLGIKQAALAKAQAQLKEVLDKLAVLKEKYDGSVGEKNKLLAEAESLKTKLERADKLVSGLSGERVRWGESISGYQKSLVNSVGDSLIGTAFRTYAGPFDVEYRATLGSIWNEVVLKREVAMTDDFDFSEFLAKPTDVRMWNIQGLPRDSFSTENGVIVTSCERWPLMIDPQEQAKLWIRNLEGSQLKTVDLSMADFLRQLENSIQFGMPYLLQDVEEELDPALEPVLNKAIIKIGTRQIIRLGEKEVDWSADFRMYITTKLANPHYTPEVSTKATIINFAVKEQGLEDQLLGIVVQKEEPKLEIQKSELVATVAAGKKKIVELEDLILKMLSEAEGSLLDDEDLVKTLQASKTTSLNVVKQLKISEETEIKIDEARNSYKPISIQSSVLFFILNDLARVDPMYQFSLAAYSALFQSSIEKSRSKGGGAVEIQERIQQVNDYHMLAVYNYTCLGLFERHKLLLSFLMCTRLMAKAGKLPMAEFQFFLKGGIVLDRSDQRENPCTDFIDPTGWDNIMELDALPGGHFKGLASTFEQFHRDWKEWYMTPCPEKESLPGDWNSKCSELQRMLILRCLRGDRVGFAAKNFVDNNIGAKYTEPPPFDLYEVYKTSTCRIPLVFVLSPGVDPTHQVVALGKKLGDIKVKQVSLGQGQGPIAKKLIDDALRDGSWVFLANCHLMLSWLGTLEKIISEYCEGEPHKDFRLWLSSNPHPKFPIAILQRAAKMTTEPPRGLKANLLRLYNLTKDDIFEKSEQKYKLKKLYFSLCWFHSILLERRKFKTLGFNIPYDFNDSDWSICADILVLYLDTYPENTPWEAIQYLTAEANYGGRVTDSWDRRLLNVYIDEVYSPNCIEEPKHRMSTLSEYYIPVDGNLESYREYIRQLPNIDKPAAFGQHSNADISSQIDDTDILLKTILSLSAGSASTGGASSSDIVLGVCRDLLEKVPETFEPEKIQEKLSSRSDPAPLKSFLMQEVQRYTKLLSFMHTSLKSLELGIQGLVIITPELETIFDSLLIGSVPTAWMFAYPSLKSLGTWIRDLQQRAEQISNWSNVGVPKSFWLAGLTYPTGFLTALLQTEARANGVGIDSLSWDFPVMANTESTSIKEAPDAGAYIVGMFLEGAQWDYENTCLKDANPMELYSLMPIVHFKPVENKKRSKGLYNCPCYYFPIRTGTRERPSYMLTVDLKSGAGVPGDFWVKRGTAILLSLAT